MEKDPRYEATLKGAGKEVAEKLYGSGDISYEQYKENNFIHDVGYDMVQLNRQEGRVTSPYGIRVNPITGEAGVSHAGIDIALIEGTKIQPMADGIVDFIGYSSDLGNHLVMSHEISYMYKGERKTSTFFTDYSHLQDNAQGSPNVTYGIGDYVGSNAFVAYSGNTGGSTGAHLHTGVLFQNPGYDPYAKWLEMQGNSAFPRKRGNRRGYSFDPSLFW
jgi:murein DD-endopeptidase MepM/ murein hydrolase activator NlpD